MGKWCCSTVQRIDVTEHCITDVAGAAGSCDYSLASNFDFRPYIAQLAKEAGETVDVSEMLKKRTVFVDQIVGSGRLNIVSPIGEAFPLHCLASGKAMLATFSDDQVLKLIGRKTMERHTADTITNPEALLQELAKVRRSQLAFDHEEHLEGVSAVGTAIQEPGGKLYAITIPVPRCDSNGISASYRMHCCAAEPKLLRK